MDKLLQAIATLSRIGEDIRNNRIDAIRRLYREKSKYGQMPSRNDDREAWLFAKPEIKDVVELMQDEGYQYSPHAE